ncbi:MAG: choice-of-anchor B family protein [Candidatus Marinimicrobia bacterium]|nr:choice-of-anchor B family protein [Candidatus Neomarinimicrobiota bacterium]
MAKKHQFQLKILNLIFFVSFLFSDCCNMQMVGYMNFGENISDITGFSQDDREFAVVGLYYQSAAFVDITDPENPFEVGRISGITNTWRDLKYWNRHVYIGTEANDGIKVVSVDDPDNPTLVNTISDFTGSHNIHIDDDGFLYVVGTEEHDIWIYELTNHPAMPQLVGTWNGEYLHDIEVYNNKLYGAGIYTGFFYIIDVSDKTNPTTILSHYTGLDGISTHDCAITDDEQYLITADETSGGHIKIWDISDYNNINLVSEYMTHSEHSMHNVYIRPETNLAIMSYYVDGTRVLDISDPLNPVEVGYFDTTDLTGLYDGHWGTYAYLPSGYIISSDRQNGLFIFSSPLTNLSLEWSDCTGIVGNYSTCYGNTFQNESGIIEELISLNGNLDGISVDEISSFVAGRVISINLSNRDLTTLIIPDNFSSLNSLSYLQLQGNQLTTIPEIITSVSNLTVLNVSDNQLSDLPGNLEELNRLTILNLSINQFTMIPDGLINISSLIELGFSDNQLTSIPTNIDEFINLEILILNNNKISDVSSAICGLPDDCMIDLTGNHLCSETLQSFEECVTTISYQFCDDCASGFMLENFCCNPTDVNVLQAIIDSNESLNGQHPLILGHNTQYSAWYNGTLEYLDLSDYNLTNIPNSIGDFEFLIEINLDGNLINSLPDSITYLESIKVLRLNNNLLSKIPGDIGNLISLEELYLSGNQLTDMPESIGNLQNLNKLFIRDNQLTSLPATICNLPDNCNIQIQDNCINTAFDCISTMGDQDNCSILATENIQPEVFQLFAPYPNPFNPITTLSFFMKYSGFTSIQVLDINGKVKATISNEFKSSGYHTVNWNASDFSSGVYFIRMISENNTSLIINSQKIVLLK